MGVEGVGGAGAVLCLRGEDRGLRSPVAAGRGRRGWSRDWSGDWSPGGAKTGDWSSLGGAIGVSVGVAAHWRSLENTKCED